MGAASQSEIMKRGAKRVFHSSQQFSMQGWKGGVLDPGPGSATTEHPDLSWALPFPSINGRGKEIELIIGLALMIS